MSGLEIPTTHLGMLMSVLACFLASFIFSLFIISWKNCTQLSPFEEEIFKRSKQKSEHRKPTTLLKMEATIVIKNFMLIRYLRKHDKTLRLRARLL